MSDHVRFSPYGNETPTLVKQVICPIAPHSPDRPTGMFRDDEAAKYAKGGIA